MVAFVIGVVVALSFVVGLEHYQFHVIEDRCYKHGYSYCIKKNNTLIPSTYDPKIQRELNRMVYYAHKQPLSSKK